MSDPKPEVGSVAWVDLTVPEAESLRDFYRDVTGWKPKPVTMGDYSDYTMNTPGGDRPVTGVCHARGDNADLPAQWLIYIVVANLDASIARCVELGGKVVAGPKSMGPQARFCVIQDPAGAVAALYQTA
jgi:predicted enzyme related to lactoylglutathione lyase